MKPLSIWLSNGTWGGNIVITLNHLGSVSVDHLIVQPREHHSLLPRRRYCFFIQFIQEHVARFNLTV